jgi:hypothetical protein
VKDGKLNIIDHEVAIVREIFNSYIQGRALSQIAAGLVERQIEFYNGVCNWNKNTISRIIAKKRIQDNNSLVQVTSESVKYRKTQEIIRYNNEISRMTNANNPSFNVVKKMIFECASLKFKECKEDTAQSYNDYVLKSINEIADSPLTIKDLQSLIISIGIDLNGEMTIKFKNGAKIKNGQTKE